MANIALNKKILEPEWVRPEVLVDNNYTNYNGSNGYTHSSWPINLTLDLENIFEIETIRFLLWDKDPRVYKYRLLTSMDLKVWDVHFDSFVNGYRSWQEFNFQEKISARYVRLHCLWNSDNVGFHIVQMQVYDNETEELNIDISNIRVILLKKEESNLEIGSGLPLTQQMKILTNSLEVIMKEHPLINPKPFQDILSSFKIQANDIEALELSIDSIRREIISPVKKELENGNKIGRFSVWGFYVGFAGFIVSIFAILNGIFKWIE
jgi:hypothetical protein